MVRLPPGRKSEIPDGLYNFVVTAKNDFGGYAFKARNTPRNVSPRQRLTGINNRSSPDSTIEDDDFP